MRDGFVVHLGDSLDDIFEVLNGLFDSECPDNIEIVKEGSTIHILQN